MNYSVKFLFIISILLLDLTLNVNSSGSKRSKSSNGSNQSKESTRSERSNYSYQSERSYRSERYERPERSDQFKGSTHSVHEHPEIEAKIIEAANAEQIIDNMFKPEKNGFLGEGCWSFVWKGKCNMAVSDIANLPDKTPKTQQKPDKIQNKVRRHSFSHPITGPSTPKIVKKNSSIVFAASKSKIIKTAPTADWKLVAMKIGDDNETFTNDFKIFDDLNAIKNPDVEKYGITSLYFRAMIFDSEYFAHGVTLLEKRLEDKFKEPGNLSNVNILCALYQAVLTLKYMHGRPKGITHQDLKPDNMMVRGKRLFIIDYDSSDSIYDRKRPHDGNYYWCSIRRFFHFDRYYMDDMVSLYYTLLDLAGVDLKYTGNMENVCAIKFNYQNMRNLCNDLKGDIVKEVFLYFHDKIMIDYTGLTYDDVVPDERIPPYDDICEKALDGIERLSGLKTAHFVWSSNDGIVEPMPSLASINGPKPVLHGVPF